MHRFLVLSVLCIMVCIGCTTQSGKKDVDLPDRIPPATVSATPTVSDSDEIADRNDDSMQSSPVDAATEPSDASIQNDIIATDAPAAAGASAKDTEINPGKEPTEPSDAPPEDGAESVADHATVDRPTFDEQRPCIEPVEEAAGWLDKSQVQVYQTVCGTVAWFDGFFGNQRFDAASKETTGRISVSGFWDQYDGFDPRFRFRVRLALPALNDRTNLLIGRGDEREMIEGQKQTPSDSIPSNFNNVEDDSFMLGLGYQKGNGLKRGFDFTVGIRSLDPFVRARFRRAWELSESTLLRLTPVVYWKWDEKFGATLSGNIDHLLTDRLMLRWSGSGNVSQDDEIDGVAWNSWLSLFQALADRKAMSYHAFVIGETKDEIQKQNFGFEVRYRRRILRKWLFLDLVSSVSWPRYLLEEERDINFGIGAGFEMYFGPVPDALLR